MRKILFLAANPESTRRLNLEKEAREIQEALDISELAKEFELIQKWEVRPKDFRRALLKHEPDIVHFSGHGEGNLGLVISDESGASKAVTGDALAGLFAEFPCVKCVLLNACYAKVQAQAIVRHVNYAIGMKDTIYDKAAIAFAIGFYDGLGYGRTIEEAFNLGSNAILWEYKSNSGETRRMIPVESAQVKSSGNLPEHLKPILFKKAKNVAEGINNQTQRTESVVVNPNPREKYRTRIQKYLDERNLTPIAKWQLATFAKEQGISESEAGSILEEAILTQTGGVEASESAPPRGQYGDKIIAPPRSITRKQFLKWVGLGGASLVTVVVAREIFNKGNITLKTFEFEVKTVNAQGQVTEQQKSQAKLFKEDLGNSVTLEMVSIPGDKFLMGTEDEEIERLVKKFDTDRFRYEKPQHEVTIQPFFMGRYPVTQAQWKAIASLPKINLDLLPNPSYFKGDNRPVEQVSWDEAREFCHRLSEQTGKKYRLPSEAEWEYACRAGTTTPFYFGETITDKLANYGASKTYASEPKGEYRAETTPVGSFPPNAFGLYDMHGQVLEWCEDDWHTIYQSAPIDGSAWLSRDKYVYSVIRGGDWGSHPVFCRSAFRQYDHRDDHDLSIGFRVVCIAPSTK